jgi:hypothetical protein
MLSPDKSPVIHGSLEAVLGLTKMSRKSEIGDG